jgi:hypothetical protein
MQLKVLAQLKKLHQAVWSLVTKANVPDLAPEIHK